MTSSGTAQEQGDPGDPKSSPHTSAPFQGTLTALSWARPNASIHFPQLQDQSLEQQTAVQQVVTASQEVTTETTMMMTSVAGTLAVPGLVSLPIKVVLFEPTQGL